MHPASTCRSGILPGHARVAGKPMPLQINTSIEGVIRTVSKRLKSAPSAKPCAGLPLELFNIVYLFRASGRFDARGSRGMRMHELPVVPCRARVGRLMRSIGHIALSLIPTGPCVTCRLYSDDFLNWQRLRAGACIGVPRPLLVLAFQGFATPISTDRRYLAQAYVNL
jgi:hypothetical protein